MRSILKSIALLGSGWGVSLILGLVSAKVTASLIGVSGIGLLGLLQSTVGLGVLAAMMSGVNMTVIRSVSRARAAGDRAEEAALRAAAWWLCACSACAVVLGMIVFRQPIARVMVGRETVGAAIVPLSLAVAATLTAGVQFALLTSHHRVKELTKLSVSNSILGPALLVPLVWIWRERALAWAVLAGAVAGAAVSRHYVRKTAPPPAVAVSRDARRSAASTLLRLGLPLNGSAVVGSGAQLALPILVLHMVGTHAVGFYRAAAGISQMYLGFLTPAMGQDYYPRAAASADNPDALNQIVNDQMRVLIVIVGPIVLLALTLVPYLVPLIYTPEFAPAARVLEWQMLGDLPKVLVSAMGFGILARRGGTLLFYNDLAAAILLLVLMTIGLRAEGVEGAGIALFLVSCFGFVVYLILLRRVSGFRIARDNQVLIAAFFCGGLVIRALSLAGFDRIRIVVGLGLAAAGAWRSWQIVRTELHGLPRAAASFSGR